MTNFTITDTATGKVIRSGYAKDDAAAAAQFVGAGETLTVGGLPQRIAERVPDGRVVVSAATLFRILKRKGILTDADLI